MSTKYFYMWVNPWTNKTCYGITEHLDDRKRKYQGHVGHDISWSYLVSGEGEQVDKLERTLKRRIQELERNQGIKVTYGNYEWIEDTVDYSSIELMLGDIMENDDYGTCQVILYGGSKDNEYSLSAQDMTPQLLT